MESIGELLLYSTVGFFAGIYFFAQGLYRFRRKRLIEDTPTSKIRSIALGPVELYGRVVPAGGVLKSPFSNKECVYYKWKAEELVGGKFKHCVTIQEGEGKVKFLLKDDIGEVLVNPSEAEIRVKDDYEYATGIFHKTPENVKEFLESAGIDLTDLFGLRKKIVFSEYTIKPGDDIYVLGAAMTKDEIEKPLEDTEHTNRILIHKAPDMPYFISDKPEDKLRRSLERKAVVGIYGGAILSFISLVAVLYIFRIL